ncbi:MAG TPA: MMPL family transporter [Tepidisphaeraceae bacterium]|jgi:predicted RND superfamily exporter protein
MSAGGGRLFRGLFDIPIHRPLLTLIFSTLLAVASFFAVSRSKFHASLESMFSTQDRAGQSLVRVLNDFSVASDLLILVNSPADHSGPDAERLIAFAGRLQAAVHASPGTAALVDGIVYRADDQTRQFFQNVLVPNGFFYLDDKQVELVRQRLTKQGMKRQIEQDEEMLATPGPAAGALAQVVLQDPLRLREFVIQRIAAQKPFDTYKGSDAFISADGRSLLIRVLGRQPPSELEFAKQLTSAIETAAESANSDHLEVKLTGAYAIAAASERSIRHDTTASVVSSVILMQILFLLAYRNPFRFALAFAPVAMGILIGFGVHALFSPELTPLTAVIGALLAGMGIDYTIQYLSLYETERSAGLPADRAASATLGRTGGALTAAFITSTIGFLAIVGSTVPALRDFAVVGTLGLAGAFFAAITILPAVLVLTDRRRTAPSTMADKNVCPTGDQADRNVCPTTVRLRFTLEPLLAFVLGRAKLFAALVIVLFVIACGITLMPGEIMPLESDLTVMHPRPNPAIDAQNELARRLGFSPEPLIVYLHADSPEALVSLAHRVNERLSTPSARAASVERSVGLATLLPDPARTPERLKQMQSIDAEAVVANFQSIIADSIFDESAYQKYAEFLRILLTRRKPPDAQDLIQNPGIAKLFLPRSAFAPAAPPPTEAMTLVFVDNAMNQRAERSRVINGVRGLLADLPGATLTGLSVVGADAEIAVRRDLPKLFFIAVALVALYLLFHFRNLSDALLTLIPTIFSLLCRLALARLIDQKLNMANLLSIPLLIGIDIDYGIFLVSLARVHRLQRDSAATLLTRLASSSHAILMCAIATFLGFGSLYFTSVPAIRSLGLTVAVGIVACVFAAFFLLAPLLLLRQGKLKRET